MPKGSTLLQGKALGKAEKTTSAKKKAQKNSGRKEGKPCRAATACETERVGRASQKHSNRRG